MRFTRIKFLDKEWKERDTFEVGEPLYVKVDFKQGPQMADMKHSKIDVAVNNSMDVRVTWISTYIYYDRIPNDISSLIFEIPLLMWAEGTYNFNLYSDSDLGLVDWVMNVAKLKVVFHDYFHTGREIPNDQGFFITDFKINS